MNLKHLEVRKELHTTVKTVAAREGISMKALTERLIRLGMVAPELADALEISEESSPPPAAWLAQEALAAYQAALEGKETP